MLKFIGDVVGGGVQGAANVINSIGKGTVSLIRPFFPQPQSTGVENLPIKMANTAGATVRPVASELPSVWETMRMAGEQWLASPYEDQYATHLDTTPLEQMVKKTQPPSSGIFTTLGDVIGGITSGVRQATEVGRSFRTVADEFLDVWGLSGRDTVEGTPREGYPEGRDEVHWNDLRSWGAAVSESVGTWGQGVIDQVKGLFNLGYQQEGPQPAFTISHEVGATKGLTIGMIVILAVVVVLFFTGKRK
jgi:hypothetical protein